MTRPLVSSYHHIHSAIGGELMKLEAHAGALDPNDVQSVGGFAAHFGMIEMVQEAHSHEEEEVLWPEIDKRLPGMMEPFRMDHEGERDYVAAIKSALAELQQAGGDRQAAKGRVYRNAVALSSHLTLHMKKEEALPYPALADRLSEVEEKDIARRVLQGLPEEMLAQAMPWWASYQTPEEIVEEADTVLWCLDDRKARLMLGAVANSLSPERLQAVLAIRPGLAQYRSA